MPTAICRYIRTNGYRCQSSALRGRALCYHHNLLNSRLRKQPDSEARAYPTTPKLEDLKRNPAYGSYFDDGPYKLNFPPLEDPESIQLALSMVFQALGQDEISPQRAGAMLYNLQIASANIRQLHSTDTQSTVIDTVPDEHGNLLAPEEDLEHLGLQE